MRVGGWVGSDHAIPLSGRANPLPCIFFTPATSFSRPPLEKKEVAGVKKKCKGGELAPPEGGRESREQQSLKLLLVITALAGTFKGGTL